jgi:hypothetical protein
MKPNAMLTATLIALNALAVTATAGQPNAALETVNVVPGATFAGCTPSQDANSPACRKLQEQILANFTPRQIDQIHWAIATQQQLLGTGAREVLLNRYADFLTRYEERFSRSHLPGHATAAAR